MSTDECGYATHATYICALYTSRKKLATKKNNILTAQFVMFSRSGHNRWVFLILKSRTSSSDDAEVGSLKRRLSRAVDTR